MATNVSIPGNGAVAIAGVISRTTLMGGVSGTFGAKGFNAGSFSSDASADFQPPGVTVVSPNVPAVALSMQAGGIVRGVLMGGVGSIFSSGTMVA